MTRFFAQGRGKLASIKIRVSMKRWLMNTVTYFAGILLTIVILVVNKRNGSLSLTLCQLDQFGSLNFWYFNWINCVIRSLEQLIQLICFLVVRFFSQKLGNIIIIVIVLDYLKRNFGNLKILIFLKLHRFVGNLD